MRAVLSKITVVAQRTVYGHEYRIRDDPLSSIYDSFVTCRSVTTETVRTQTARDGI